MKLKEYCEKQGRGTAIKLSRYLGCNSSFVYAWFRHDRPIPIHFCPRIENYTGGAVRCEELRPDVDWVALRQPNDISHSAT